MKNNFIKFCLVAIFILSTTFSFAAPRDIVITTSDRVSTFCVGADVNIKVYATDTLGDITNFTYQWLYSPTAILTSESGWVEVSEATQSVLPFDSIVEANAGYYYCKVFYGMGSNKKSPVIQVVVDNAKPAIVTVSAPADPCEGTELLMQAEATGFTTRNWYHDGEVVSHLAEYRVTSASLDDSGIYW